MYTHRLILYGFLFATILETVSASEGTPHFKGDCDEGEMFRTTCYSIGRRTYGYSDSCERAIIRDKETNEFIKDMMAGAGLDSVWIGKANDAKYNNFDYSSYGDCYYMKSSGQWYASSYCSYKERETCMWKADCQEGWIGEDCDRQCHCHKENCTRKQSYCRYGCEPGWTGEGCFEEASTPVVEHYCFKYGPNYTLMLSLKGNSKTFGTLVPLDAAGNAIDSQSYDQQLNESIFEISTDDLSASFEPNFLERKVDETTFEWSFRLRQVSNLRMQNDVDFTVQCNFSDPDAMSSTTSLKINLDTLGKPATTLLEPSQVDVDLVVTDPKDTGELTNLSLGQAVKIIMTQKPVNEEGEAEGDADSLPFFLSPRKCFVRSEDRTMMKQLSDFNGCPLEDAVLQLGLSYSGTENIMSQPFSAFGVPGYSNMDITCTLELCRKENRTCTIPCGHDVYRHYGYSRGFRR